MSVQVKRGRPKYWLNDPRDHLKILQGTPCPVTNQILENAKQLERLLREGEPRGVPTWLLAELNDVDDLNPEQRQWVLDEYRTRVATIKKGQQFGANRTRKNAQSQQLEICKKNLPLITQIKPNGLRTVHSVAKNIRDEWEKRGSGGRAPSLNTLSTYIKQHRQRQA